MTERMTIGQLADATNTATTTLRYDDDLGLVRPAGRVSGQRRYSRQAVRRLRVIDDCQQAGFTLEEVARLLDGGGDWQELACGCEHMEGCERTEHLVAR